VTSPQPIIIATIEVNEKNSAFVEGDVVDEQGDAVTLASVTAFVVTIYDDASGDIINSRDAQSILNVNGGTFHATTGHFSFTFADLDNPIVAPTLARGARETHTALLDLRWGTTGRYVAEVRVRVRQLRNVA
jgi:hypothetical protein